MLHWNVRNKDSGFTLIEMLTVVIIIGVIAAIASPNFLGMLNQNRLKEGQLKIEGSMREAQRQATRKGVICKIRLTTDGSSNVVAEVAPGDSDRGSYSGCLLNSRLLADDIEIKEKDGTVIDSSNTSIISFSPKGSTTNSGEMIRISHPNISEEKCVEISGVLGDIITGTYQNPVAPATEGTCQTS